MIDERVLSHRECDVLAINKLEHNKLDNSTNPRENNSLLHQHKTPSHLDIEWRAYK
jgi:hypothetical protein